MVAGSGASHRPPPASAPTMAAMPVDRQPPTDAPAGAVWVACVDAPLDAGTAAAWATVPACGASLDFMLEVFPVFEVVRKVMT